MDQKAETIDTKSTNRIKKIKSHKIKGQLSPISERKPITPIIIHQDNSEECELNI